MRYDFDQVLDRTGTLSYKWEAIEENYPKNPSALPFWIADMDFPHQTHPAAHIPADSALL